MATPTYDSNNTDQQALIARVEYQTDQVTASSQTIGLNKSSIYTSMIEAARHILRSAPQGVVIETTSDGSSATVSNVGSFYTEIECPDDFIRFVMLKLADWQMPIFELTDNRSNAYRLQYNTQAQADTYAPLVFLAPKSTPAGGSSGNAALWCFPQDSAPTVEMFEYVGTTAPEDMPAELVDPMLWHTTARTLQAQKENGFSEAFERAQASMRDIYMGYRGEETPSE